jgi:predicted transcriptional regulator
VLDDQITGYWPDIAAEIDTEVEIVADEYGVDLATAKRIVAYRDGAVRQEMALIFGRVLGILIGARNLPVMVHSLALAAGLDQLNGAHSEAEVARELGVTRSLVSHYVVGWRDVLSGGTGRGFDVTKFRKRNATRAIYAESAKSKVVEARNQAMREIMKTKNAK